MKQNGIGDDGFRYICQATYLSNLTKLIVDDNKLSAVAAKYQLESKFIGKLRYLSVGKNEL